MAFGKYAVDYEQRVDYPRLRRERVAKVKAQMEADGIGAIITWDPDNIRYIASYYVTTPMRASEIQAVFIARNGEPHLIGGGTPSETARRMPWLAGVQPSYGMPRLSARDSQRRPPRGLGRRDREAHGGLRCGERDAGGRRLDSAGPLLRGFRAKGDRHRPRTAGHGLRPHDQDRRRDRAHQDLLRQRGAGARGDRGRHPAGHPGVRSGRHRYQGALCGGGRPHRGSGLHERGEHQPLRLDLHRSHDPPRRPGLRRRGRRLLPGLQDLHLPHLLLRQGHRPSRRSSSPRPRRCCWPG